MIGDLFDLFSGALQDTRLEPDLDDLLWSLTNLFHTKAARVQRQLDENEDKQQRLAGPSRTAPKSNPSNSSASSRKAGRSVERRDAFEHLRDLACRTL